MVNLSEHEFGVVLGKRTERGLYWDLSEEAQEALKRIYPWLAELAQFSAEIEEMNLDLDVPQEPETATNQAETETETDAD